MGEPWFLGRKSPPEGMVFVDTNFKNIFYHPYRLQLWLK